MNQYDGTLLLSAPMANATSLKIWRLKNDVSLKDMAKIILQDDHHPNLYVHQCVLNQPYDTLTSYGQIVRDFVQKQSCVQCVRIVQEQFCKSDMDDFVNIMKYVEVDLQGIFITGKDHRMWSCTLLDSESNPIESCNVLRK